MFGNKPKPEPHAAAVQQHQKQQIVIRAPGLTSCSVVPALHSMSVAELRTREGNKHFSRIQSVSGCYGVPYKGEETHWPLDRVYCILPYKDGFALELAGRQSCWRP